MITPMAKVTLIGPRRLFVGTLDLIHSLGVVHLEPFPIPVQRREFMEHPGETTAQAAMRTRILGLLTLAERLLVLLPPPPDGSRVPTWLFNHHIGGDDLKEWLDNALAQIEPAADALASSRNELAILSRYSKVVAALYPLLQQATEVERLDLLGIILEKKRERVLPLIEREMDRLTSGRYRVFSGAMDRDNIAAILAYPKDSEGPIRQLFAQENIAEIRLPAEYSDKPLATTLRLLYRSQRELPDRIREHERLLLALSVQWYGTLSRIRDILAERLDELGTTAWSAQSRHTFFLQGWMPENKVDRLIAAVGSNLGDDVLIRAEPARHTEAPDVPVLLRNWPFVRQFEPLVNVLALPRYGSLDPTPYIALFFPVFFGFILGDIGYGLILMAAAILLRKRLRGNPFLASLTTVFLLSSVSCIVFGLLFGEFFGNLGEHFGLHPILWDRSASDRIMSVLYIALGLGLAHILLGFALSLVMNIRQRHHKHWISAAANIMSLTGLVFIIAYAVGFLPLGAAIGALLLGLGIPTLVFTEGLMGPMEFLKTFGNVLSYARLMAIGISSVVLAKVANMIGGTMESLVLGVLIAIVFHTLNFVLGVFSPTIHSLRLHYVEFFSKFYQPGGKPYRPFKRHRSI